MNPGTDAHPLVLVSAFLDGELSPPEAVLVEAHLAGCSSCRVLLEDYRVIAETTASLTPPPVSEDLRARINRRLGGATGAVTRRPGFWPQSYRVALGAAAGVVLVLGLWILNAPGRATLPAVAQPAPASSPPAPARKAPEGVPIADVRRTLPGESADRLGAPGHPGGSARRDGPVPPSASHARESVAPGDGVLQEEAPVVAGKDAPRPASPSAAPRGAGTRGRILLFEFPDHRISLSEDGTLTLSSGQYACTVRPVQPPADREVARLFRLASQRSPGATGSGSPAGAQDAPVSDVITLQDERGSALRATGRGIAGGIDPAAAVEMDTRLRALLREQYIDLLESRCGTVPQAAHSR